MGKLNYKLVMNQMHNWLKLKELVFLEDARKGHPSLRTQIPKSARRLVLKVLHSTTMRFKLISNLLQQVHLLIKTRPKLNYKLVMNQMHNWLKLKELVFLE